MDKASAINNFGASITGATEIHCHKDGSSKTFVLQKEGNWKKTEETRVLTFRSKSNKMEEEIIKVEIQLAGSIEDEKEYSIFLAKIKLICAEHELDLFEY